MSNESHEASTTDSRQTIERLTRERDEARGSPPGASPPSDLSPPDAEHYIHTIMLPEWKDIVALTADAPGDTVLEKVWGLVDLGKRERGVVEAAVRFVGICGPDCFAVGGKTCRADGYQDSCGYCQMKDAVDALTQPAPEEVCVCGHPKAEHSPLLHRQFMNLLAAAREEAIIAKLPKTADGDWVPSECYRLDALPVAAVPFKVERWRIMPREGEGMWMERWGSGEWVEYEKIKHLLSPVASAREEAGGEALRRAVERSGLKWAVTLNGRIVAAFITRARAENIAVFARRDTPPPCEYAVVPFLDALAQGTSAPEQTKDAITDAAEAASQRRTEHIERFAAAFLKQTGLDPTRAELVEQCRANEVVWFFREREDTPAKDIPAAQEQPMSAVEFDRERERRCAEADRRAQAASPESPASEAPQIDNVQASGGTAGEEVQPPSPPWSSCCHGVSITESTCDACKRANLANNKGDSV